MNEEKMTVSGALMLNWYSLLSTAAICCCISALTSWIQTLLWSLAAYFVLIVVFAFIALFVYSRIFMDRITLSADGIVETNRLRTRTTGWNEILQAGFMSDNNPGIIVLVRNNGSKRKAQDSNLFFHLRNTGKLIAIPGEPGVEELVRRNYGPVDFDLREDAS